jgi:hypothetical protein
MVPQSIRCLRFITAIRQDTGGCASFALPVVPKDFAMLDVVCPGRIRTAPLIFQGLPLCKRYILAKVRRVLGLLARSKYGIPTGHVMAA